MHFPIEVGLRWRAGRNTARVLPLHSSSDGEYGGGLGILRFEGQKTVEKSESIDSGVNVPKSRLGQNGVTRRARLESASCGECRSGLGWVQSRGARGVGLGREDREDGGWPSNIENMGNNPKRGTDETQRQQRTRVAELGDEESWQGPTRSPSG